MSTSGKNVFFTGATGYIGGTVLQALLTAPTPPASITVLIRDASKADLFTSLSLAKEKGVKLIPLVGSLEDTDKLKDAASAADVVVDTANADHLEAINALIQGMKARKEKTGHRPLFIHTSGTGVLVDDARGAYPNDKVSATLERCSCFTYAA